jgi:hypothetical protein
LPALNSGGEFRELAVALTLIGWKTVLPPESAICATEIRAEALPMNGPFLQLPEAAASLNFTATVFLDVPLNLAGYPVSVGFNKGDWNPQNFPASVVDNPAFTNAKTELLCIMASPAIGPPTG